MSIGPSITSSAYRMIFLISGKPLLEKEGTKRGVRATSEPLQRTARRFAKYSMLVCPDTTNTFRKAPRSLIRSYMLALPGYLCSQSNEQFHPCARTGTEQ